jgi:hemoglobin
MYYKYIFPGMHESLTEISIGDMVDTFYGRVREDDLLGPIFADAIGSDWEPHLKKMKAFWSSVLLASRTYKGNPMIAHLQLPLLRQAHFERWLQLWSETANTLCSSELARLFSRRAQTIGATLLTAISRYRDLSSAAPVFLAGS